MAAQDRLVTAITALARMSAHFDITDERMTASAPHGLRPATVPATDVAVPQADEMGVLHETVF